MLAGIIIIVASGFAPAQEDIHKDSEKDVAFVSQLDRSEQRYVLWLPEGIEKPDGRPVIIALHGHGSDRWQFIRNPRDECRAVRDAARKHGMAIVSPDYRACTSWMGPAAEADVLQIISEYHNQYRPERIILAGGSMGASSALTFAAMHPEAIDGVVALNGIANHIDYPNFQDAISASFGGDKNQKFDEYKKRSAEYWPERLTMPISFTIGTADQSTPPQSVMRLAAVLTSLARDVLLIPKEGGGHETNYEDSCKALEFVIEKTAKK